jgi:uncharacterized RDD family membrane protein YckC
MFTIIGGDGREYGPATADQVRAWINGGRANLDTRAKVAGSSEWRRLGDFPEFGGTAEPPPVTGEQAGEADAEPALPVVEPAGIGARTGAALINAFLYFCSLMPGGMWLSRKLIEANPELAKGGFPKLEDLDLTGIAEGVIWVYAGLFAVMLVQALLIVFRGQNIGKLLTGVKVVRVDDGGAAGFARGVMLRFALPVSVFFLLNVVFPLGVMFIALDYAFMFRADRRCLHDLIAGTQVVRA